MVSYRWQTRTWIPCSGGRVWRGAGVVYSRMCYRAAAGGGDRQSYHYTLTEHIQAFRVSCSAQVHCANDIRVDSSNLSFATKTWRMPVYIFSTTHHIIVGGLEWCGGQTPFFNAAVIKTYLHHWLPSLEDCGNMYHRHICTNQFSTRLHSKDYFAIDI
jgi:hypothetical protein